MHKHLSSCLYDVLRTLVSSCAEGSVQPLTWDIRFKIVIGVAQGLSYMHSPEVSVIHRDLKSSNILLDEVNFS